MQQRAHGFLEATQFGEAVSVMQQSARPLRLRTVFGLLYGRRRSRTGVATIARLPDLADDEEDDGEHNCGKRSPENDVEERAERGKEFA
jgi:hypothetical protein